MRLVWLNSPSNPTGAVTSVQTLREVVAWGRQHNVVIVNDECYIELGWDVQPVSILHPDVVGDEHHGVLAVHSLSKRSNLAGYRGAFITGDRKLVLALLEIRKHSGLISPGPVQAAMLVAYNDDAHVVEQKARYAMRRTRLRTALEAAGFEISNSEAGLYLWGSRGEDCWETVGWLADRGILVAPGAFYGAAGAKHVRIALTGTDSNITSAAARLQ
jgi:succinyldiaminopimelate transaminase